MGALAVDRANGFANAGLDHPGRVRNEKPGERGRSDQLDGDGRR